MGISKWLARTLAVGGTARTIAKQYNFLRTKKFKPGTEDRIIFSEIVLFRFKYPNTKILIEKIDNGDISSVKELVIEILSIEAGFRDNQPDTIRMFEEVIEEELKKKGIL